MMLGAFLPERESDFQALWYYGLLLAGIGVLAGIGSWFVVATLRPLWRRGERSTATLLAAVTATMVVLLLTMAVSAVIGLAWNPGLGAGRP